MIHTYAYNHSTEAAREAVRSLNHGELSMWGAVGILLAEAGLPCDHATVKLALEMRVALSLIDDPTL